MLSGDDIGEGAGLATRLVVEGLGLTRSRPDLHLVIAIILENMKTRAVLLVVGSHGGPAPDRNI